MAQYMGGKMKSRIKVIRIIIFSIFFLMVAEVVVVECVDVMSTRSILIKILYMVCFLLAVILAKMPQLAAKRITILDILSIVMFIGLIIYMGKMLSASTDIQTSFQGNNEYVYYYAEGEGNYRYDDIESLLKDEIENRRKTGIHNKLEEIYRMQIAGKIFVYFRENDNEIIEYDFFRQNNLYYCSGNKALLYGGIASDDKYTTEETIRKDIANTMWRGVGYNEVGVPAWGVSTDDQIFSMTINAKKVDDVILIDEKDGKKYYFWITSNVEEIKTIDDVKAAKIEINGLQ